MSGCESEQRARCLSGRHHEDADRHVFHSVQRHGYDERDRLIAIPNPFTGSNKQRSQHDGADHQYSGKRQNDWDRYRRTSITKAVWGEGCPGFLCPSFARWLLTELNRTARAAGLPLPTDRCRILPMPNSLGDPCPRQPLLHLASPTLIGCADCLRPDVSDSLL